jgi:hypothetical protein
MREHYRIGALLSSLEHIDIGRSDIIFVLVTCNLTH